jgi:arginine repressor
MRWAYFKNVRNINLHHFFEKRKIKTKEEILNFLNDNNFTFSQEELNNIYTVLNPVVEKPNAKNLKEEIKQTEKESKDNKALLPQKKKRVRNSSKRKRHVSGSMDTTGRD